MDASSNAQKHIPRVLAIEDEPSTRELLTYLLKRRYEAELVPGFEGALAQARKQPFDAVLIDISLSGEHTGEDVMEALREIPNTASAAMVACTAYAMPGDREHFLERGFDGYVSKPFTRERLYNIIDELAGSSTPEH